jgi:histidinol-phosphatase (PHP family)
MLDYSREIGLPITLGSDAHQPAHLTRDFDRAFELLKQTGFTQIATYTERKRVMINLE